MHNTQVGQSLKFLDRQILHGNCLLAELYRLSLIAPCDFFNPQSSPFYKLLVDFSYFEDRKPIENFAERTEEGRQLEEKFYPTFSPFLKNFAQFLNKLHTFIVDFANFTADFFIYREHLERLKRLEEFELLCAQLLYFLGLLLLLLDFIFPANAKEYIFVAIYRLKIDFDEPSKLQTLVDLLRNRREPFETCFTSLGLDDHFLNQTLKFIRFYKGPCNGWMENCIYVCLYFEPKHDTLQNKFSIMRQIIDNFFVDRWILHMYINFRVNLYEKWERFKAANAALSNSIELCQAPKLTREYLLSIRHSPLPSGLLSLEMFGEYKKLMIELNGRLKWLILHSTPDDFTSKNKKLSSLMPKENIQKELLKGLKELANFEFKYRQCCAHLRANREESVNKLKQKIVDNFAQILAFLRNSPTNNFANKKSERIIAWLDSIRTSIEQMNASNLSGPDSLQQIVHIQTRIAEFRQIQLEGSVSDQQQIILNQSFLLAHADLQRLQNVYVLDEKAMDELVSRNDSTYLFCFVDDHRLQMEELLREDALSVKYIFLKIANSIPTMIYGGLKRGGEREKKLASFYYKVLEIRLRSVIQAIPRAIFDEMAKLHQLFSTDSNNSIFVEKAQIKEFADFPGRRKLSELTYKISKLALGIANTCLKQLGDLKIQPRALLCDGLRDELKNCLSAILSSDSSKNFGTSPSVFNSLRTQQLQLQQFRKAFLFVCDHVGIRDGLQIWAEQLQLQVKRNLTNKFAQIKMKSTIPSSTAITISPSMPEMNISRFFDFVIFVTRPTACIYNRMENVWRSAMDGVSIQFTHTAFACLESWMLFALGKLFGLVLDKEIQKITKILHKIIGANQSPMQFPDFFKSNPDKIQQFLNSSTQFSLDGPNRDLFHLMAKIGQIHLLLTNLQMFLEAEAQIQLGVVHKAGITLRRSLELVSDPLSQEEYKKFRELIAILPSEFHGLMPNLVHVKNAKCHFFLLSIILRFSTMSETSVQNRKKREFLDTFTVLQGGILLLEQSPLWKKFLSSSRDARIIKENPVNSRISLPMIIPFNKFIE